jgi:choline dehydrogenase
LSWDYVIVGGGSAGCVLARRLSDIPGLRVLVLEAGGEYRRLPLSVPLAGLRAMTAVSWKYLTCQQPQLADRRISWPLGRLLGGSSSNNAMMYCRGHRADFDGWGELGNPGWSFRDVLPYFRRSEDQERGPSDYHGVGGPLRVSDPRHRAPFSEVFVTACEEIGLARNDDFNGAEQEGAGFYQVTQRHGARVSTAEAYLEPARGRRTVEVITGAMVCRILVERGRAVGVEYRRQGGTYEARAAREVILSAGAVNSPKLLLLSGIGPADQLCALQLPVVVDLPGVGQNLQDHLRVPLIYESGRRSPGHKRHWISAAIDYAVRRQGVLASNCCESGAFVRSCAEAVIPDLQLVTHFQSSLHPDSVDLQSCVLRPSSRGRVWLRSADPLEPPLIDPNYLSTEADVRASVRGVRLARRIAAAPALRRFPLGTEVMPGADVVGDAELERYVRATAETSYHPVGTCRMGCDALAVVDAELRVRGVAGLRVVDASVMPEMVGGNTLASTVMIAEKGADLISARASLQVLTV